MQNCFLQEKTNKHRSTDKIEQLPPPNEIEQLPYNINIWARTKEIPSTKVKGEHQTKEIPQAQVQVEEISRDQCMQSYAYLRILSCFLKVSFRFLRE
jgi:hypothetical protein